MTDYFKTIHAYLRGKWGRKSKGVWTDPDDAHEWTDGDFARASVTNGAIPCSVTETIDLTGGYASWRKEVIAGGARLTLVSSSLGSLPDYNEQCLRDQIARLRRSGGR